MVEGLLELLADVLGSVIFEVADRLLARVGCGLGNLTVALAIIILIILCAACYYMTGWLEFLGS